MEKNIHRKRCNLIFLIFFMVFGLLGYRLFQICYYKNIGGKTLDAIADGQYYYAERTCSINYKILDKNGEDLLPYVEKYKAVIDPFFFSKNDFLKYQEEYNTLYYILKNYNDAYDIYNLDLPNTYTKIFFDIDEKTCTKLKTVKNLKGIYAYKYSNVDRTNGNSIENIITSENKKNITKDTLEYSINSKIKTNKYPTINFYRDVNGNIIKVKNILPENNINLKLTVNKKIEEKIRDVLNSDYKKKHDDIGVVIMEADTGNILTLTQKNNQRGNVLIGLGTENGFYPGSIFKVIVEEAAIENSNLSETQMYYCKPGKGSKCSKSHGYINVDEAFVLSCNNTFIKIGDGIKYGDLLKTAKAQGLFSQVLKISGEKAGDIVAPIRDKGGNGLISIGQNMRITPVQALGIVNTVVTGGKYVKPKLIDSYVDNNNNVIEKENTCVNQVIKKSTADVIKKQMKQVNIRGTGTLANIKGIENGGKTGTSTRPAENGKTYSDGWYVGFFNISGKYYSMVVFVKDIDMEKEGGGNTAAPIFKSIVESIKDML